jgi:DNA-binding NtrC family response regulator
MKQHLLVVDDEAPIRELLSTYLKRNGYEISAAVDAAEAERLLADKSFDLAILDVLLPDSDGLDLLQRIKAAHPRLPVIIMTGIGFDEELLQEAIHKGAAGYLSKTAPLDQLLMEVQRALNYNSARSM